VLKVALTAVGRDRVVKFLAGHLGRLIAPMVGPQITPALSRAIVDAGMRELWATGWMHELCRILGDEVGQAAL
jgi:hypothetical protein